MSQHRADEKHDGLKTALLQPEGGHNLDMELEWLKAQGALGGTRKDLWTDFLDLQVDLQATPPGHLQDRQFQYFGSLGYTGTLPEKFLKFWENLT